MNQMSAYEYRQKIFNLSREGQISAAYEVAREGLTLYPANPFLLSDEIYLIFRIGRVKEARQKAEEQFQILKGNAWFLRTYLSILHKDEACDDILRLADSGVLTQDFQVKAKPDYFIAVAKIIAGAGFKDKAIEILRNAPQSEETDKEIERLLSHKGKGAPKRNPYEEKYKGKRSSDVVRELEMTRLLPEYKGDFDLHHHLADRYKKTKQPEKASEIYKYLLTIRDDDFTRNRLGHVYKDMGLFDEALVCFKEGLMKDPLKTHLHTALIDIFVEKKDPDGCERFIHDILAVHPKAGRLYGVIRKVKTLCSE
jgi:tetratricopeptide (TPR) repeat protein